MARIDRMDSRTCVVCGREAGVKIGGHHACRVHMDVLGALLTSASRTCMDAGNTFRVLGVHTMAQGGEARMGVLTVQASATAVGGRVHMRMVNGDALLSDEAVLTLRVETIPALIRALESIREEAEGLAPLMLNPNATVPTLTRGETATKPVGPKVRRWKSQPPKGKGKGKRRAGTATPAKATPELLAKLALTGSEV